MTTDSISECDEGFLQTNSRILALNESYRILCSLNSKKSSILCSSPKTICVRQVHPPSHNSPLVHVILDDVESDVLSDQIVQEVDPVVGSSSTVFHRDDSFSASNSSNFDVNEILCSTLNPAVPNQVCNLIPDHVDIPVESISRGSNEENIEKRKKLSKPKQRGYYLRPLGDSDMLLLRRDKRKLTGKAAYNIKNGWNCAEISVENERFKLIIHARSIHKQKF
ncbi:hypothetical protein QAD02_013467 [Eretmocerus hayati]|uniref:Uncharacterized protein n=1 Tax=Eretmocerus hayati TaxID=131215 RepID=A0ACC2P273_9HYME|nr:hypothetical protein QAD02_013467 [Eretmocerus hayati]